jgi:hypothetical protein
VVARIGNYLKNRIPVRNWGLFSFGQVLSWVSEGLVQQMGMVLIKV